MSEMNALPSEVTASYVCIRMSLCSYMHYYRIYTRNKKLSIQFQLHLCMKCMLPHHFHDMSAPLGEQLHALQGQVEQLPVLSISLLGLLTP